MLTTLRRMAMIAALTCLPWLTATAGVFDCKCQNGTDCKISCGCSGSISCAQDNCAGGCGACPQGGYQLVAETTAAALYRNAFILTKGDFDEKQLVEIYRRLLSPDSKDVTIRKVETPDGGLYITVSLQTEGVRHTLYLIHSLHLPEPFYSNMEIRRAMADTVAKMAPEIVKRKDLDPSYLKQFIRQ